MRILIATLLSIFIFVTACSLPDLFDSQSEVADLTNATTGHEIIIVQKTGGIAGINQKLVVLDNGEARLENHANTGITRILLPDSELRTLINLFIDNQFFFLENKYVATGNRDVFAYEITYKQADQNHTVYTDYLGAPENLTRIVDGVEQIFTKIADCGIELKIQLDKENMAVGDTVTMMFQVRNVSTNPIVLYFKTDQVFNFWVKRPSGTSNEDEIVWNWDADKVFTPVLHNQIMAPGETRIFQAHWHGLNNDGRTQEGNFSSSAELMSTPGGVTGAIPFRITTSSLNKNSVVVYGDSLRLTLTTSDTVFTLPAVIKLTMTGENISSRNIQVPLDKNDYNLQLMTDLTRNVVWSASEKIFLSDFDGASRMIPAGAIEEFTQPLSVFGSLMHLFPRGVYTVKGKLYGKDTGELKIRIN